jgi:hypothetical protein
MTLVLQAYAELNASAVSFPPIADYLGVRFPAKTQRALRARISDVGGGAAPDSSRKFARSASGCLRQCWSSADDKKIRLARAQGILERWGAFQIEAEHVCDAVDRLAVLPLRAVLGDRHSEAPAI